MRNPSEEVVEGHRSEPPARPVTLPDIAELRRSGSTLLKRVVGRVPGCFLVGDVVFLWQRGMRNWRRSMPGRQRLVVTVSTWPLRRYGHRRRVVPC
jgi:hypothetical protein